MRIIDKLFSILLVVTSFLTTAKTQHITIAARSSPFCGLLKQKIYCYGGEIEEKVVVPDSTMYDLDITQAYKANISTLGHNWKVVTPDTAGVNTEERGSCQYAVIGGTRLVVSGCYNCISKGGPISDQTIVYDAETNSWKKYPNYMEQPYGNRQIYQASTAVVPSKGIAFYGGTEQHFNADWTFPTNQNISATQYDGIFRAIGYRSLTYLNIDSTDSLWTVPHQSNIPSTFSAFQTSIFDPVSKSILFFGGLFHDTLAPGYDPLGPINWHPFSYALTFNTETNAWGRQNLTGIAIPTNRRLHSTTLLPKGESTVLLYGGEGLHTASNDYCYTLDLKTFNWTQHSLQAPSIDLRRSKHAAVLVNNDSLFIIHGLDGVSTETTALIVLNVSSPTAITYMETYTDPNALPIVANDTNGSKGLTSGAIAGISVGVAIIGLLGIGLFLRKRAKRKLDNHEPMEIDWDEIEKHYAEIDSEYLTLKRASPDSATDIAPPAYIKGDSVTVPISPSTLTIPMSPNTLTIPMSPATVAVPSSPIEDHHESSTTVVNIMRPINSNINSMSRIIPDAIDEPSSKQNTVKPDSGAP